MQEGESERAMEGEGEGGAAGGEEGRRGRSCGGGGWSGGACIKAEKAFVQVEVVVAGLEAASPPQPLASPPAEPEREPEREREPEAHVCSEACDGEGICPRARAMIDALLSAEAADAIDWAYEVVDLRRFAARDDLFMESLDAADLHLGYALRRLLKAYPTELNGFIAESSKAESLMALTVKLESLGTSVPAAVDAARRVGYD